MSRTPLDESPLILAKFDEVATAGGFVEALRWARDNGYAVPARLVPTPVTAKLRSLGSDKQRIGALLARPGMRRALRDEERLQRMADELQALEQLEAKGQPVPPSLARTDNELREMIVAGTSGLSPLAAVERLDEIDHVAAMDHSKLHHHAIAADRQQLEAAKRAKAEARAKIAAPVYELQRELQRERDAIRRSVEDRYRDGSGEITQSTALREELERTMTETTARHQAAYTRALEAARAELRSKGLDESQQAAPTGPTG